MKINLKEQKGCVILRARGWKQSRSYKREHASSLLESFEEFCGLALGNLGLNEIEGYSATPLRSMSAPDLG
jgi:hypothetical protein